MSTIESHRSFQRGRKSAPSSPAIIPASPSLAARRRSVSRSRFRRRRSSSSVRSIHFESPLLSTSSASSVILDENALDLDVNSIRVCLDNTLPVDYFKQDLLSIARALQIPKWRKIPTNDESMSHLHLVRLSGALTNCIYKVTYKNYYPLLLRIYGANVGDLIDRNNELATLARLSRQNIGPKLLGCFGNGRFEEFLNNSITLTKDQIRDRKVSRMIARRMKQLHLGVPLSPEEVTTGSKAWRLIDKWIKIVDKFAADASEAEQSKILILNWSEFKALIFKYRDWLFNKYGGVTKLNGHLKFCHNDTQYGNLLFYNKYDRLPMDEDEPGELPPPAINQNLTEEVSKLSLDNTVPLVTDLNIQHDKSLVVIDFEYSGPNIPAYDITNHFFEWMYDYADPEFSYRANVSQYPTRQERINFLNSYVNYVPGSATPVGYLNRSSSSVALAKSASVVNLKEQDLPKKVVSLYNETILWRSSCAIFWALWGIISNGTMHNSSTNSTGQYSEVGPQGQTYNITVEDEADNSSSDDDKMTENTDDKFDHLKYTLGKAGVIMGDMIQFGLLSKKDVPEDMKRSVKYLDTELLHSSH